MVARLSGDEFIFFLDASQSSDTITPIISRILNRLHAPVAYVHAIKREAAPAPRSHQDVLWIVLKRIDEPHRRGGVHEPVVLNQLHQLTAIAIDAVNTDDIELTGIDSLPRTDRRNRPLNALAHPEQQAVIVLPGDALKKQRTISARHLDRARLLCPPVDHDKRFAAIDALDRGDVVAVRRN